MKNFGIGGRNNTLTRRVRHRQIISFSTCRSFRFNDARMKKDSPAIGIIGGSGLYQMEQLRDATEHKIDTPFGSPSDVLIGGKISDRQVLFFAAAWARSSDSAARTESSREYLRATFAECALDHLLSPRSAVCRKNMHRATFCCRRSFTTERVCVRCTRFSARASQLTCHLPNRSVSSCGTCSLNQEEGSVSRFTMAAPM